MVTAELLKSLQVPLIGDLGGGIVREALRLFDNCTGEFFIGNFRRIPCRDKNSQPGYKRQRMFVQLR